MDPIGTATLIQEPKIVRVESQPRPPAPVFTKDQQAEINSLIAAAIDPKISSKIEQSRNSLVDWKNTEALDAGTTGVDSDMIFAESPIFEEVPGTFWPGYGYVGADRWYDTEVVPDTAEDHLGTAITDNSTADAKTWLKVSLSANTVSYENNGPGASPHGTDEVWFKVSDMRSPFMVPRTG